jgi:hypothetical protein
MYRATILSKKRILVMSTNKTKQELQHQHFSANSIETNFL